MLNNQDTHLLQGVLFALVGSSPTRHQEGWEKGASTPVVNYKLAVLLGPILLTDISLFTIWVISLKPGDAMVNIGSCNVRRLFGAQSLLEPVRTYCETISVSKMYLKVPAAESRNGWVIISHKIKWGVITYQCLDIGYTMLINRVLLAINHNNCLPEWYSSVIFEHIEGNIY